MEENCKKNVVNHFAAGSNCQVFNGNITGCVFAMPGSTVCQQQPAVPLCDDPQPDVASLVACVERVREYLWGDSALAVVFCVCRDRYGGDVHFDLCAHDEGQVLVAVSGGESAYDGNVVFLEAFGEHGLSAVDVEVGVAVGFDIDNIADDRAAEVGV